MPNDESNPNPKTLSRRQLLRAGGLSVAAGVVASGVSARAAKAVRYAGDLAILNVALGLEHQAIAAYDAGAASKLLNADQLKIAVSFQNDHKRHRDALTKFIKRYGGTPVAPKASYDFGTIGSATDIVKLAQSLEDGAMGAYLANAGKLENREILDAAVPILEDEVRHNTVFKQLLGMDVTGRLKY
ncbi:MAG: ferritin-like domain-containing protein [Terriglobales bacterium]|jgi:rubrerythrin